MNCEEHNKYDAVVFENFLKNLLKQYPTGKTIMILDNVKLLQPLLQKNKDRLKLVFLPPYSPELHLIEGLLGWLKSDVITNIFCHITT